MEKYPKIQTVFLRELKTKVLIEGKYSLPEFEYLKDNIWSFTEKVDGTNIRIHIEDKAFTIAGKEDHSMLYTPLVNVLNRTFIPQMERSAEVFNGAEVCLYGEGYGPKIQKGGGNYRKDPGFVLFDVKIGHWWLQRKDVEDVAKMFGLEVVPIIGEGTLPQMVEKARHGFSSQWGDFKAEGIVARPKTQLFSRHGERLITKVKYKDFLKS